jgi:hypothetical protein
MCDTKEKTRMGQTQTTSNKAESYTWGIEIECFLPNARYRNWASASAPTTRDIRSPTPSLRPALL